jgi:ABC-type phosphate transport system permease subunit
LSIRSFPQSFAQIGGIGPKLLARATDRPDSLVFGVPLAMAVVGAVVGMAALASDQMDPLAAPTLALMALALGAALAIARRTTAVADRVGLVLVGVLTAATILVFLLPEWIYGFQFNALVNRTAISAPLLLVLSTALAGYSVRFFLGNTPGAGDYGLYPWLLLPLGLAGAAYALVIGDVVVQGIGGLQPDVLTRAWTGQGGNQALPGLLNQILGTLLLMFLSLALALPPGIGAGVFMAEYPGRMSRVIDFSIQMLRAVSLFVLGAVAFIVIAGLASASTPATDPVSQLVRGVYSEGGLSQPENGSFLFAAGFVALVIMPIIAKMTEEGLRSVPRELREASVALGARDGFSLRRLLMPWAAPNVLTGVLIAAAEANGCLAIVAFMPNYGQFGVGPLGGVTTLEFAIFGSQWNETSFHNSMRPYQMTCALLLVTLTVALSLIAMLVQRRVASRSRGSITAN